MNKNIFLKIGFSLLLLFSVSLNSLWAQQNTLYNMKNLSQFSNLNPAHQPNAQVVVGLPIISSFYGGFSNSGFTINDVFKKKSIAATKPYMLDIDNMRSVLQDKNALGFEIQTTLLNVGVALQSNYFLSLGINTKISESLSYPNIFELTKGNYRLDGSPLTIKLGNDFTAYNEIYVGLSKKLYNGFTIGVRAKYLAGIVNMQTNKFDFSLQTNTAADGFYELTINTDLDIRSSSGFGYQLTNDSVGNVNGVELKDTTISDQFKANPASYIRSQMFANSGLGIDLGAVYEINRNFRVSASLIDVGFLKWKNNPQSLTQKAEYVYAGFDPGKYVNDYQSALNFNVDTLLQLVTQDYQDTLSTIGNPTLTDGSYKTKLNAKVYLGANYTPVEWFDLGLLYRGVRIDKKMYSSFTVSGNLNFLKGWAFSTSYTRMFKTNNIGLGLAWKIGPFQYYIVSDNITIPFYALNNSDLASKMMYNTKQAAVHFGFNFVINKRQPDYGLIDEKLAY